MLIENPPEEPDEDAEIAPVAVPIGLTRIVDAMYADVNNPAIATGDYFANRTILTATSAMVHRINDAVSARLDGDADIHAKIMTGERRGQDVMIPRIVFISDDNARDFPYRLRRKQFPMKTAFAMTINKAQGQTVFNLGLHLASPCFFSHGQLYVALSRVTPRSKFKAMIEYLELEEDDGVYTANIVYRQIFETA